MTKLMTDDEIARATRLGIENRYKHFCAEVDKTAEIFDVSPKVIWQFLYDERHMLARLHELMEWAEWRAFAERKKREAGA